MSVIKPLRDTEYDKFIIIGEIIHSIDENAPITVDELKEMYLDDYYDFDFSWYRTFKTNFSWLVKRGYITIDENNCCIVTSACREYRKMLKDFIRECLGK